MNPVSIMPGKGPLVLSMPHVGTMLPPDVSVALNDVGRAVPDTDWWLDRLYADIARTHDATIVRQNISRFVIDVNRDPTGVSLYPGKNTTPLCPLTTFDDVPIYRDGCEPDAQDIARRKAEWFAPFHAALAAAVQTTLIAHGHCVLYDCHSIRSRVPFLFDGDLPVFNLGTNDGRSCSPGVRAAATDAARATAQTHVVDGRFKGGWITRHYGAPERGIEAVQMELAQCAYMQEAAPWTYEADRAQRTADHLGKIVSALVAAAHAAQSTRAP